MTLEQASEIAGKIFRERWSIEKGIAPPKVVIETMLLALAEMGVIQLDKEEETPPKEEETPP